MSAILKQFSITLSNQSARYYKLIPDGKIESIDTSKQNKNVNKVAAHFYPGNGFSVGVYQPLLVALSHHFDIGSLALRGCWYDKPNDKILTREQDAEMLIEFLDKQYDTPVVGIGHSQGASATALAAAMRPELFSSLYLIEPVTFTRGQKRLYDAMPRFLKNNYEPFKSTITKQNIWSSIEAYYHYLRCHPAHKRMSDEHLRIYAQNNLIQMKDKDEFELIFPPKQELANYHSTPFIDDALKVLSASRLDYHIITGKPSMFINKKVRKNWQTLVPESQMSVLDDYGHLLPMEAPEMVANLLVDLYNR